MQRFYLPPDETRGDVLTLSDREAHHALNVVRLRSSEVVMVLNGEGDLLTCETAELARREVRLRVTRRETLPPRNWPLTLIQAIPKGKTFDTIVQKATELGARRVVPLVTQRVVSQIESDRHASKVEHWRAIAIESIKQCGSPWLPEILAPIPLKACLAGLEPAAVGLVASLRGGAAHPWAVLEETRLRAGATPGPVHLWVGPEGDFTDDELDAIEAAGVRPVTLGSLVLRADTAAIYGMSVINCATQRGNLNVSR